MALIFITVGSVVLLAVLTLADTNMRATIQLNGQANETAAAEAAANIVINELRNGSFGGTGSCFGTSNARTLPSFYTRSNGTRDSARVTCDLDPTNSTAPISLPSLLTVDTTASGVLGPFGISVTNPQLTGSPNSLRVTGDVQSNSNIVVQAKAFPIPTTSANLTSSGTIRASTGCSSGSGLFNPSPVCNAPAVTVPASAFTVPIVAGLPTQAVPACGPVMTLHPGRYTDWASLTARTSTLCQGGNGVMQFLPGTYYFEFGPSSVMVPWTLTAGTVVGGTLRPGVTLGPGMALSNNCVSPVPTGPGWSAPAPGGGVTFVFSGGSQMVVSGSAKVELCASYTESSAPIAVAAESTTGLLATTCNFTNWPCAAVWTATPTAFVVQGTVYLPSRELVLNLNNATTQSLRDGVVVHRIWANTARNSTTAVIEPLVTPRRTVVLLTVNVCLAQSTCGSGEGDLQLRAKVSIVDPTGTPIAGQRKMTVLNWSIQP